MPPLLVLPRLPSSSTSSSALWWAGCTGWLAGSPWRVTHSTWGVQPAGVAVVGAAAAAAVAEGERDMHSILPSKKVTKRAVLLIATKVCLNLPQ